MIEIERLRKISGITLPRRWTLQPHKMVKLQALRRFYDDKILYIHRQRDRTMKHALMAMGLIVASIMLVGAPVVHAQSSEQVVFSGTGTGSFQKTSTTFSFSIW